MTTTRGCSGLISFGIGAVALLLVGSGCATSGTSKSRGPRWPASLQTRAAFDLSCPADELKLTPLEKIPGCFGGTCLKTAGVEGCGKKVTYLYVQAGDTWVLNADSR